MGDSSERLLEVITAFEALISDAEPGDAVRSFDDDVLVAFWREWPGVRSWGDAVWGRLDEDLAQPSTPATEADLDEVGGGD